MVRSKRKKNANHCGPKHGRSAPNSEPAQGKSTPQAKSPQKSQLKSPPKIKRTHDKRPLKERFGKGDTMVSAQRMVDMQRRNADYLSQTKYCSAPPMRQDLFQVRLVIPGDHLAPKALGDLSVLDDVRREHEVWITREAGSETFFDLSSVAPKSLRTALDAISRRIKDMRLSEESLAAKYFVQAPKQDGELAISFELGQRPAIKDAKNNNQDTQFVLNGLAAQFAAALPSAAKTLVALPGLKMKINFGLVKISAKRKTVGNQLSLEEFQSALDTYSSRGRGASIETEFASFEVADNFLASLLNNEEIKENAKTEEGVALYHHAQFDMDKQRFAADLREEDGVAKATSVRCTKTGGYPTLDWIISAPDMDVDWSLQVTTHPNFIDDRSSPLHDATTKFVESFVFKIDQRTRDTSPNQPSKDAKPRQYFKLPRWQMSICGDPTQVLSNFKIKSCARIQYRDTPYEIEVSITQHWASIPASAKPDRLSWSVSVYGIHWEEALGEIKSGETSDGFEERLFSRLWPGQSASEENLKAFLECVLQVQTAIAQLQA